MADIISLRRDGGQENKLSPFIVKAIGIASLGGILFGYDLGVVSAALPQLTIAFDLTDVQKEMVVSFLYTGAVIGAALGGTLCDISGRKTAILFTDIIFIIGSIILFLSESFETVLIGRFVVGFAVAVSGIADVAYLHEISPMEYRGAIVSVNEACISFGFMVSYLAGYGLTLLDPDNGWRIMFGVSSVIALIQFCGMLAMPESPVWLEGKGKHLEAERALQLIYGQTEISSSPTSQNGVSDHASNTIADQNQNESSSKIKSPSKVKEICLEIDDSIPDISDENSSNPRRIKCPFKSLPNNSCDDPISKNSGFGNKCAIFSLQVSMCYRQLIIAFLLTTMSHFCGNSNILNFAPAIFAQIGFDSSIATLIITVLLGLVKFIVTCCVIWKIDHFGRKPLLLYGTGVIILSLFILFIAYESIDEYGVMSSWGKSMAIIGVFGVAAGYATSFGPLVWLLVSELFPSDIRGRALGVSNIFGYLSATVVSYTFLSWQNAMGSSAPFAIYGMLTTLFIIFSCVAMPETGGKDFDQIGEQLDQMLIWNICQRRRSLSVLVPIESNLEIV